MINKIFLMLNIALFPFKDLTFYNFKYIESVVEDVNNDNKKKPKDKRINKDRFIDLLYRNIMLKCQPSSLDEINLMLQKYYPFLFNKILKSDNIEKELYNHYFDILMKFARALLSHRDGEIVYKYWESSEDEEFLGIYIKTDKVHLFNVISRFIPIDILVSTYYSINEIEDTLQLNGFYQHINLADAQLHDVLEDGVAENHIHATSAFNFNTLWYLAMNNKIHDKYFDRFKTNQYATYNTVKEYISTAQVLRIILAKYLYDTPSIGIYEWIDKSINNKQYKELIIHSILNFEKEEFIDVMELKEIIDLLKKDFGIDDGDRANDIIFSIFRKDASIKTYGENILLHYVFKYRRMHKDKEIINDICYTQLCKIFFKYISIKNEFYQQVTQSTTIKGLDFFKSYFDRATDGFDKKSDSYYSYMLRTLFQNEYLKKVELRVSILDNEIKNKQNIKRILNAYKDILEEDYKIKSNPNVNFPRIGIVYHLIKQADDIEKCWCIYDKNSKVLNNKLYYKNIQNKYFALVEKVINIRNKVPYLANFIVGIDAASLENNTPIQVFAPVFERARNSNCDPILIKDKNGMLIKNKSLFFTFHAGEDFRHINSGLRRIDEVIDYCKFHSGDRIGHGIALGTNIDLWVNKNPVVIIPQGEYLDNLLWIWGVYSKNSNISSKAHIYLEQQIYKIAKEIFKNTNGLTPAILYDTYVCRFNSFEVKKEYKGNVEDKDNTYKFCPKASNEYSFFWDSEKLQHAYHCKCYLEGLTKPIYVNTSNMEKEMTIEMQKYLIKKVSMSGIVVEVNPTSNYAIGEVNSVYDNQFFNINLSSDNNFNNILVNINSDNPMVFNTNVSNEIAYLYYGMLERGIGKEIALKWIEKTRKCGIDTSFIRSNISNQEYISSLYELIDALDDPTYN